MSIFSTYGQLSPSATNEEVLLTVPDSDNFPPQTFMLKGISACNRGSSAGTIRVAIVPGGGAAGNANWLFYDTRVAENDTLVMSLEFPLTNADEVRVYASSANFTFMAYGMEPFIGGQQV